MTADEASRISGCITQCGIIYNKMNTTPEAQALWCGLLDGINIDDICEAFLDWCRHQPFPPTPADIRTSAAIAESYRRQREPKPIRPKTADELYVEKYNASKGSPEAKAAWEKVEAKRKAKEDAAKANAAS